ncbi:hypothetical protein SDC9_206475 [bioreactor metagenome]|uniref:Uncharacterized protein n=1 Tax=bioreactor metagenome TaxID=1076179 RepID=A0A645J6L5_9ZZZZ
MWIKGTIDVNRFYFKQTEDSKLKKALSYGFSYKKSTHETHHFVSTLPAKPSRSDTIARFIQVGCNLHPTYKSTDY